MTRRSTSHINVTIATTTKRYP